MANVYLQLSAKNLPKDITTNRRRLGKLKGDITKLKNSCMSNLDSIISTKLSPREGKYYRRRVNVNSSQDGLGFSIWIDTGEKMMRRLEYGYSSFYLWDRIDPAKAKKSKEGNTYYDIPFKYYLLRRLSQGRSYHLFDYKTSSERSPHLFLVENLRASRFREVTSYGKKGSQPTFTSYKSTTKPFLSKFKGPEFRFTEEMASSWKERGFEKTTGVTARQLVGATISGTVQTIRFGKNQGQQRMIYTHLVAFKRMDESNKHLFYIKGRKGLQAIKQLNKMLNSRINHTTMQIAGG